MVNLETMQVGYIDYKVHHSSIFLFIIYMYLILWVSLFYLLIPFIHFSLYHLLVSHCEFVYICLKLLIFLVCFIPSILLNRLIYAEYPQSCIFFVFDMVQTRYSNIYTLLMLVCLFVCVRL